MEPVTVDMNGCARCGEGHGPVTFLPLTNPVELDGDVVLTHWAPCTRTGEPILLRIVPDVASSG